MPWGVVLVAWACLATAGRPAYGVTLQDLLNGGFLDAGASRFSQWQLTGLDSTATPRPNLAQIAIVPLVDDLLHPGLHFESNGPLATTGVNAIDVTLTFRVDVLAGGKRLVGQSLELEGVIFGGSGGLAYVSQEATSLGGSALASTAAIADNESDVFQLLSASSFAPRSSLRATANVFITGLATADAVNLTRFNVRVAQTGAPPLAGGFDGDGDVDAADLAHWRGDFGANDDSDADNDGDSDGADFLAWQRNRGLPTAVGAAGGVPEPSGAVLSMAIVVLGLRRRSRSYGRR